MPSEIPKCITPPCPQNSKLVNPPPPLQNFRFFHQALWNDLFDSVCHLHDLMNRNLHAFPSPPKYSAYKNESERLVSAPDDCCGNCQCCCFVCETASRESVNTGIFWIEFKPSNQNVSNQNSITFSAREQGIIKGKRAWMAVPYSVPVWQPPTMYLNKIARPIVIKKCTCTLELEWFESKP